MSSRRGGAAAALFLIATAISSCQKSGPAPSSAPDSTAQWKADSAAAVGVVVELGHRMKRVSLLAPDTLVARSLRQEYGQLVSSSLLESWIHDPRHAPGRLTSSPWPDTIEVREVARISMDEVRIDGDVLERTSTDLASGTASDRKPVRLAVTRQDGRWLIARYEASWPGQRGPVEDRTGGEEGTLGPAGAAAWIESYYSAINEGRYRDAYAHWEQGGTSSGKSYEEFRKGFAGTSHVDAEVGPPGPMGAAAGSRYVEVPVKLTAHRKDGSRERYAGTYTLRRAVVDGATAEQRAWRIYSARVKRAE